MLILPCLILRESLLLVLHDATCVGLFVQGQEAVGDDGEDEPVVARHGHRGDGVHGRAAASFEAREGLPRHRPRGGHPGLA